MPLSRRDLLASVLVGAAATIAGCRRPVVANLPQRVPSMPSSSNAPMYGLIGKMSAAPDQREALLAILLDGTAAMPGCLSYVIAKDAQDPDGLWITEVWDSQASHQASLKLPAVQAAIAKARPLITGFSNRVETVPVGGPGLRGA
jgi:quinol monooxygenase YgiN